MFGPVKKCQTRASDDAGDGKEELALVLTRKAGGGRRDRRRKAACEADGGRAEKLTVPEPRQ